MDWMRCFGSARIEGARIEMCRTGGNQDLGAFAEKPVAEMEVGVTHGPDVEDSHVKTEDLGVDGLEEGEFE